MYYIQSKLNPADLGTKFERFHDVYKEIGDDSLFRKGPECLELGIEEAVRRKQLIPIDKIMPSQREKESAALEMIKLHQLVITKNRAEGLKKPICPTIGGKNILLSGYARKSTKTFCQILTY